MVRRSKGLRSKSRHVLQKKKRERGLSPITYALQEFSVGDKVNIVIDPSIHGGMPHHRFHGKTGDILERRGNAYMVKIRDGDKLKDIIVRPEHLRKWK